MKEAKISSYFDLINKQVTRDLTLMRLCPNCYIKFFTSGEDLQWNHWLCSSQKHNVVWAMPDPENIHIAEWVPQYLPAKIYRSTSLARTIIIFFNHRFPNDEFLFSETIQMYDADKSPPIYHFSVKPPNPIVGEPCVSLSLLQAKLSECAIKYLVLAYDDQNYAAKMLCEPKKFDFTIPEYYIAHLKISNCFVQTRMSMIIEKLFCDLRKLANGEDKLHPEVIIYFFYSLCEFINEHPPDHTIAKTFFKFCPATGLYNHKFKEDFKNFSREQLGTFCRQYLLLDKEEPSQRQTILEVREKLKQCLWEL